MSKILSKQYNYYVDGGVPCKRNSKENYYGSYKCLETQTLEGDKSQILYHEQVFFDHKGHVRTNNMSEFASLIVLLDHIIDNHGAGDNVCVFMDSQVVLNSIWGTKKIKDEKLIPLQKQAMLLISSCTCNLSFQWISGKEMKKPDLLGH